MLDTYPFSVATYTNNYEPLLTGLEKGKKKRKVEALPTSLILSREGGDTYSGKYLSPTLLLNFGGFPAIRLKRSQKRMLLLKKKSSTRY